jgi:hypothetical protein
VSGGKRYNIYQVAPVSTAFFSFHFTKITSPLEETPLPLPILHIYFAAIAVVNIKRCSTPVLSNLLTLHPIRPTYSPITNPFRSYRYSVRALPMLPADDIVSSSNPQQLPDTSYE